jgi:hypothetical protein
VEDRTATLADHTGLQITVCHFPPGTSKWNKIEHRLFSYISRNWRGQPLASYQVIINLIAATTTSIGLKVYACLDENKYPKIEITGAQLDADPIPAQQRQPGSQTISPWCDDPRGTCRASPPPMCGRIFRFPEAISWMAARLPGLKSHVHNSTARSRSRPEAGRTKFSIPSGTTSNTSSEPGSRSAIPATGREPDRAGSTGADPAR